MFKKKLYKLYIYSNENEYLIHIKKLEDWKNKKLKKKEIGKWGYRNEYLNTLY